MSVENKATQLGRANEADDASGPIQLSDTTPTRLIQSTGNLYWSSNPWVIEIQHASKLNVPAPTIFRASKSSQPGEEVALYTEPGTGGEWTSSEFGALTFAKVDDQFYGYFVANYTDKSQTTSQIKRIPLGAVTRQAMRTSCLILLPPRSVSATWPPMARSCAGRTTKESGACRSAAAR